MKTLIAIALSLIATQASALSCLKPDVVRSYENAAASEKTYVVLNGAFTFPPRPPRNMSGRPQAESFPATFSGTMLTRHGFGNAVTDIPLTVNSNCAGQWCGRLSPHTPYVAFVEQDGSALTLHVEACTTNAFAEPTSDMIDRLERRHQR